MSKYGFLAVLIAVVYCMSCCKSQEVKINATESLQFWQGNSEAKVSKTNEIKNYENNQYRRQDIKKDENVQHGHLMRSKNEIKRKSGKKKTKRGRRRRSKKLRRRRRYKKHGRSEVKVNKTNEMKNDENNQQHHHVRSNNRKKRHMSGKKKTNRGKRRKSRKFQRGTRRRHKNFHSFRRRAHVGRGQFRIKRHQRKRGLRNNETDDPFPDIPETFKPYTIAAQLKELETFFPDENITQEIIGRTAEYKDIVLLKIKYAHMQNDTAYFRARENVFVDEVPERKILFIVHGLTLMGFSNVPCLSQPSEFMTLLDYYTQYSHVFDIFVIPLANPDGFAAINYQYWNKNMSPQKDCPGVALDRNFDVAWNGSKGGNTCSQQYPGPFPFSEPETQAIRDVLHRYGRKIVGYFHVHGGMYTEDIFRGDAVLYPKGYTEVHSDDDRYIDLKGEIDEALRNESFRFLSVAVETLHNWYGPVAGTSVDYASTVYGIPYAMEFSMQLYENSAMVWETNAVKETDVALNYIWQPIINVIFEKIYNEYSLNDEDKPK